MDIVSVTFECKRCKHKFIYETSETEALRLPFEDIHCPRCNWSPIEEFGKEEKGEGIKE